MTNKINDLFNKAIKLQTSGNFTEACSLYQKLKNSGLRDFNLYYLYGMAEYGRGSFEAAIKLLKQAQIIDKTREEPYIALNEIYNLQGDFAEGHAILLRSIENRVISGIIFDLFATSLFRLNDFESAKDYFAKAITFFPEKNSLQYNLALCLEKLGQDKEAEQILIKLVEKDAGDWSVFCNLGLIQVKLKQNEDAFFNLNKAFLLNQKNSELLFALGHLCIGLKKYEDGVEYLNRSISLDENNFKSFNALGSYYLLERNDINSAEIYFNKALAISPEEPETNNNAGCLFFSKNELDLAISLFDKAIKLKAGYAEAHKNRGLALLMQGNFLEGWKENEYRWFGQINSKETRGLPEWAGEYKPNLKIYVYKEQGLGDTIQFVRYLKILKDMGVYSVFECQDELIPLLNNSYKEYRIISFAEKSDHLNYCDYEIPLLSLPRILGTNIDNIPSEKKYLFANEDAVSQWKKKIHSLLKPEDGSKKLAGFIWAGNPNHRNDKNRSGKLNDFVELFDVDGWKIVNLQKGKGLNDLGNSPIADKMINLGDDFKDWNDSAAIVENMDLIISVDTAMAHLAGAMGKETFLLLSHSTDWRWLLNNNRTTWYPTFKLIRQEKPLDWSACVNQVRAELNLLR